MNDRLKSAAANPTVSFVLRTAAWVVLLFGALRLERVQAGLLIPFASMQERVAALLIGRAESGVVVDSSCTGSDALALCIGAVLAFPASWARRLTGAAVGFLLITVVNTVRIGHLAAVVDRRELFDLLHLKLWPAAIIVVAASYVFLWMRAVPAPAESAPSGDDVPTRSPLWRFVTPVLALVALYYLVVDRLYDSSAVQTAAHWAASVAGGLMTAVGIDASVGGGLLRTPHGYWLVTPQCILTPLLPIYLGAVLAAPMATRRKFLALAAAPFLFLALGTARLLVLALPPVLVGSHLVAVHAFYQVVAALTVVAWTARRAAPNRLRDSIHLLARSAGLGALAALAAGLLDVFALTPLLGSALQTLHLGHGVADLQGVLVFLLAFQVGLYVAVSRAAGTPAEDSRWQLGLAAVVLVALATRIVLGELTAHLTLEAPTVLLRGWALTVPLVLAWLTAARTRLPVALAPGIGHASAA